jgi:FKBP-type peptidyl-prolyl cis-trans isomerase SlyD
MQISKGKVASFHYTLTNDQGTILDRSESEEPLSYIHGFGMIIPGLEQALVGRSTGDTFRITIEPAEAYGERHEELIQNISPSVFPEDLKIEPGMQFHAQTEDGTQLITVMKVEDEQVTIDANHPLAGERLTFQVEVTGIREATEEEKSHGHVHTPGVDHS